MDIKHIEQTFSEVAKTAGWTVDKLFLRFFTRIELKKGNSLVQRI